MPRLIHAVGALALAAMLLLGWTAPAAADPIIFPAVLAALGAIGVTGTVATVAATIITGLLVAAIGIGLQLLFTQKPKVPQPEDGSITVQQAVAPRVFGYGTARMAGAMALSEEYGGNFYFAVALAGHRVDSFIAFWLNDDQVAFVGGTPPDSTNGSKQVAALTDKRYTAKVAIDVRKGLVPETAFADLVADIPTWWSSSHRGDGCASLMMTCASTSAQNFSSYYPYGKPQPSAVARLSQVYDPRDGTQDPNAPSTWKWSDNPVLCAIHFRCFSAFGPKKDYASAVLPVVARWIEEANRCDDLLALKAGGTEKRYRCGGWTTTKQDDKSALQAIIDTCDGWHIQRGDGTEIFDIGLYRAPTVTLTDADIVGYDLQIGVADEDNVNSFGVKFTSPDHAYSTIEVGYYQWDADQASRGKIQPSVVELTWVQWIGQASRLLKRTSRRAQQKIRGVLYLRLSGLNALYERRILVQSNSIPWLSNAVIENRKPVLSLMTGASSIEFVIAGAEIDVYSASTDELALPPVPQRPTSVGPPIPANVSAVPFEVGGSDVSLNVTFDSPLATTAGGGTYNTSLNYVVRWRIADVGGGTPGGWTETTFTSVTPTTSRTTVTVGVVTSGTNIDVQIASIATSTRSDWSTLQTVSTTIAGVAPGVPTSFSATGHVGNATLACTNPNSPNMYAVQFWRAASGGSFASASPIGTLIYGAANAASAYTDTVAAGTYTYYATAQNSSGVNSTPAGPQNATVT